jgi:hypothetical protein
MPLRLFASRERSGAYASRILFLGAMLGFWFFMTQYLQGVHDYSPFEAGLAFLPMTIANFAMALAAIPSSACASAGASLMPSPAIATTRPCPCSRFSDSAFWSAVPRRSSHRCQEREGLIIPRSPWPGLGK